jgi:heptosyltransferase III
MKRILVVRGGAIGDFVLTLPALKLLRERYPQAHIEILGYKHILALAENRFYAQAVRSIEYAPLARFFAKEAELPQDLCDFFASFNLVVSYLFDPDQTFERNLRRCDVENILVGSPKISGSEHAALQLAHPLQQLGLSLTDRAARVFPSHSDQRFAMAFHEQMMFPTVALHPGSGSARKNWPISGWLTLAETLLREERAGSILIVGGEADEEELAKFRSAEFPKAIRFAENLPLPQLAAVLQNCAVFAGHDSGISHLAAAVETPCVLLFGPTDPAIWAPQNRNVRVLRASDGQLLRLEVSAVIEAVLQELMRIGIST